MPWYAAHRDLPNPVFCATRLYARPGRAGAPPAPLVAAADAVIVGLLRAGRRGGRRVDLRHGPRAQGLLRHRHAGHAGEARARRARLSLARPDPAARPLSLLHRRPDPAPAGGRARLAHGPRALLLGRRACLPAAGRAECAGTWAISAPTAPTASRRWSGCCWPARAPCPNAASPWPARSTRTASPGRPTSSALEHLPPPDAPGLLRRPALHPEPHPCRHGGGRLVALACGCSRPRPAACRSISDVWEGSTPFPARARRSCSPRGAMPSARILRDLPEERRRAVGPPPEPACWRVTPRRCGRASSRRISSRHGTPARPRAPAAGRDRERGGQDGQQSGPRQDHPRHRRRRLHRLAFVRGAADPRPRVLCLDNFQTGCARNIDHLREDAGFASSRTTSSSPCRKNVAVDGIYNLACAASPPQYQRDPVHTLKTSVLGSLHLLELRRAPRRHDPPGLDQRGLRRPGGASPARELCGQRQPGGPACLLRRGQARRRDAVLRLPPHPRRADQGGPDLQHLRAADARGGRPDHLQFRRPRRCAASR